jgi:hypothetical protein
MAAAGGDLPRRVTVASNAAPAATAIDNAAYLSSFPVSRSVTPVTATSQTDMKTASAQPEPIFRSLFQAGERTQPISPAVQELWGSNSSLTSVASVTPVASSALTQTPEVRAPGRLDLFSDRNGTFS